MGGTSWSNELYADRQAHTRSTGRATFVHDENVRTGRAQTACHPTLNPRDITMRESRDSEAHPDSLAVAVFFDITGSMDHVPRVLQTKLPNLMNILLEKGYCKDPQLLMGAIGDYLNHERAPLQVGQFESGVEIDENLSNIFLERNGGGNGGESYQNALYFLARKTSMDCWEKRGKKGFTFIIGDELPFGGSSPQEIEDLFGDKIEATVTTPELVREVKERFNLFFIIPGGTYHSQNPAIEEAWKELIGPENVLRLPNADLVCEILGATIGMFEKALTLDQVKTDLGGNKNALAVCNALDALANSGVAGAAATGGVPEGASAGASRI